MESTEHTIIREIEEDIRDRRGLKHEWNAIDEDVKEQIREAWRAIVRKHITCP